jgi:hypothetical protein
MIKLMCLIFLSAITTLAESKSINTSESGSNADFSSFCTHDLPTSKASYVYGFEESHSEDGNENLKCKKMDISKYKGFTCHISTDAFGSNLSPYLLERTNHRVFVFKTIRECRDGLDTMNANAP